MNYCHICLQIVQTRFRFNYLLFTKEKVLLCRECQEKFIAIVHGTGRCAGCLQVSETEFCQDCDVWWEKYQFRVEHDALFSYNEDTRNYLWQIKVFGDCVASHYVAEQLKPKLMSYMKASTEPVEIVVIPSDRDSDHKRGFCFMEYVVESMGFATANYLMKTRQTHTNNQEESSFTFTGKQGSRVILLDDVYQTGTTLFHAKQCCEENECIVLRTVSLFR